MPESTPPNAQTIPTLDPQLNPAIRKHLVLSECILKVFNTMIYLIMWLKQNAVKAYILVQVNHDICIDLKISRNQPPRQFLRHACSKPH